MRNLGNKQNKASQLRQKFIQPKFTKKQIVKSPKAPSRHRSM